MKIRRFLPLLTLGFCAVIFAIFLALLVNPVSLDDGLRHLVMGRTMAKEGVLNAGGWDRWFFAGSLSQQSMDPWFLSDVLYVPFASVEFVTALKVIAFTSFVLTGAVFLFCLTSIGIGSVASSILLVALLFGYDSFTYRLMLGRPFPIVTILSLLLILSILKKRPIVAGILLCVLALLSQLFVFAVGISVVGCVWLWAMKKKKSAIMLGGAIVIGVGAGIALHPEPFAYLQYLGDVFFRIPFLSLTDTGGEMKSGFGVSGPIYLALLIGGLIGVQRWKDKTLPTASIFLAVLSLLFLTQFFVWIRAIDFLWPVLLLFVGSTLSDNGKALEHFSKEFVSNPKRLLIPVIVILFSFSALSFGFVAKNVYEGDESRSLGAYEQAMLAVLRNSKVLNLDWGTFPPLVSVRSDLSYAQGVDTAFTYLADPAGHALLESVDASDEWFQKVTAAYPADYLFFRTSKYPALRPYLIDRGYRDVSGDDTFAVFPVKKG